MSSKRRVSDDFDDPSEYLGSKRYKIAFKHRIDHSTNWTALNWRPKIMPDQFDADIPTSAESNYADAEDIDVNSWFTGKNIYVRNCFICFVF